MDTKDIIKKIMDDLTPTEYPELYSRGDVEDAIRKALDMQTGKIKKQEQSEVDLEQEAVQFCFDEGLNLTPYEAKTIARHFYELGRRAER